LLSTQLYPQSQKAARLDSLEDQMSTYMFAVEGNLETLQGDVERLTKERDEAQSKLTGQYTASTIAAAKMYLEATAPGSGKVLAKLAPGAQEKRGLLPADLDTIAKGINDVADAGDRLLGAGRALAGKLAQLEKARATDTRAQQAVLQRQITRCRAEIEDLTARLRLADAAVAAGRAGGSTGGSVADVQLPPGQDARWMEVSMETSVANKESRKDVLERQSVAWERRRELARGRCLSRLVRERTAPEGVCQLQGGARDRRPERVVPAPVLRHVGRVHAGLRSRPMVRVAQRRDQRCRSHQAHQGCHDRRRL
jgi:hypothetical protein